MATDRPEAKAHPFRRRTGADQRRLPWRPLLIILGIFAALTTWYLFTVDAITDEAGLLALQGRQEGPLTGIDPEKGIGFTAASLKNDSVLPITVLGVEPVDLSSDWRVREMRLGVLADEGEDALVDTGPFVPQHLNPGEIADVVIVWAALPCDSPRLADGRVSGPVEVRIVYSILGVRREHTFHHDGGSYGPLSVIGCPGS